MVVCTPTKRARIVDYRQQGLTYTEIGKRLEMDRTTVRRNYQQLLKNPNPYYRVPIPGRPRAVSPHSERCAARAIANANVFDATDAQRQLFPHLHPTTVRRMFIRLGLYGRVHWHKPFLSKIHRHKRRIWAESHVDWTLKDWQQVVFSDESKFNLWFSDGRRYCRRRPGEQFLDRNLEKTVKHGGGSLQVCLTAQGTGRLHRVEGRMNAAQFCAILEESLKGSLFDHQLDPSTIIYQQDLDPKHTSHLAAQWFAKNHITLLPWAPSSPDMNIIEHAWDLVDHALRHRPVRPHNIEELWLILKEEWEKLDIKVIQKLYASLPDRVKALKEAKGGPTRY
ncbi:hypothetical protein EWM64_g2724 [Hericium alpestre]|uniref:Tc1-like transposase DDE domain-containing protein n=1 Tax=Hericium alpestre TaxID=135208 RepID=A0A4Z0A2L6_9AGAM|nr:hypothetical protein EWM64_g2724 [Hericium alpestre]